MKQLTIRQNGETERVSFEGTPLVQTVLAQAGRAPDLPCGGRGRCGKCAVTLSGQVSAPNAAEQRAGVRLSCQAVLLGDAQVVLPDTRQNRIEASVSAIRAAASAAPGLGAAIDIGTTTLVLKLYDLQTGQDIATAARMNPQRAVAADVMGRIGAALSGQARRLQSDVLAALQAMLDEVCRKAGRNDVVRIVAAGNTTMLYLLTARNPDCLAHAPFEADTLFDTQAVLLGLPVYYPSCMNAFVGADITCAVLASGMCEKDETALLCDIGTNGEIALYRKGRLFVTSTAAGPAFEGAGISCGCGSVDGAIDHVWVEDGEIRVHTIADAPACGLCGSGLIDAVAVFLETEQINETGAAGDDVLPLSGSVALSRMDIRAVQLAKAAIAAGIQVLLEEAGIREEEVRTLYIAGGFGSHLNAASAAAIGLYPASMQDKVRSIGNASLSGAAEMLLCPQRQEFMRRIASSARHIQLGGNPRFNALYVEKMLFGNDE